MSTKLQVDGLKDNNTFRLIKFPYMAGSMDCQPYFVYASSDGSGESADLYMFVKAIFLQECNKKQNITRWHGKEVY